jgi:hypothetical protein
MNFGGPSSRELSVPAPRGWPDIRPISSISPYTSRSFTVLGRVSGKGSVRTFTSGRTGREGKVGSFTINGQTPSDSIKCTCWAGFIDKFWDSVENSRIYFVSGARCKVASQSGGYELHLDEHAQILAYEGEIAAIPSEQYRLVPDISTLGSADMPPNSQVDVCGAVRSVGTLQEFLSKAGRQLTKLEVGICDRSLHSISVTLWGESARAAANNPALAPGAVVVGKDMRLAEFQGARQLNEGRDNPLAINPAGLPVAAELRQWYAASGATASFTNLSASNGGSGGSSGDAGAGRSQAVTPISDIARLSLGLRPEDAGKAWFTVHGTITAVMTRSRLWYDACPDCGRKVQGAPGAYECMKCGKTQMPACSRKFCGAVKVQDYTGSSVMRFFDQAGQQLLGATADDLYKVNATAYAAAGLSGAGGDAESPDGNPEYSEELLRELAKKTHRVGRMRCIARRDEYNGEERQSVHIHAFEPLPVGSAIKDVLAVLEQYKEMQPL